jgi:hypothetical protein
VKDQALGAALAASAAVLQTGRFQDRGSELVAVDGLHQEASKADPPLPSPARPIRDQGDGRYRPSQSDLERPKLKQEFAPGLISRLEIAHEDVADECCSKRVGCGRCGDDRAGGLEHRPKEMARRLGVVDHEDVNAVKYCRSLTVHCLGALPSANAMSPDGQALKTQEQHACRYIVASVVEDERVVINRVAESAKGREK